METPSNASLAYGDRRSGVLGCYLEGCSGQSSSTSQEAKDSKTHACRRALGVFGRQVRLLARLHSSLRRKRGPLDLLGYMGGSRLLLREYERSAMLPPQDSKRGTHRRRCPRGGRNAIGTMHPPRHPLIRAVAVVLHPASTPLLPPLDEQYRASNEAY